MGTAVYGNFVTGNFFSVLGVRPKLGRFFLPEEDRTQMTSPVIVISEAFWPSHLGADSSAIAATKVIAGFLFGVSPLDAVTFIGMAAVFAAVALLATSLPARRAAAANPMVALRGD